VQAVALILNQFIKVHVKLSLIAVDRDKAD